MTVTITVEKPQAKAVPTTTWDEVQALKAALSAGMILEKDKSFANSLISQYAQKGKLSDKQRPWLTKLVEAGKAKSEMAAYCANDAAFSEKLASITVTGKTPLGADVTPLFAMFEEAAKHLKKPSVELETYEGLAVRVYKAAPSGTMARLKVTTAGAYPHNKFIGCLSADGLYTPAYSYTNQEPVKSLLRRFAADPAAGAAKYGTLTGKCCFCGQKLTDPKSTAVGYGPKCAEHYHLPWGGK